MPTLRKHKKHQNKPWYARVKREGVTYNIGHFKTRAEALAAEDGFAVGWPRVGPSQRRGEEYADAM
jgi:hypothetical protein